eukprot:Gregarina_sp_Poly_1__2577@NODE_16_length_22882_cov_82_653956_g14_i0_p5_GENE_NODE_16_length_22882_cov_82_653956_g14_i0NODE_16_length_22882_cov_82_653956_g14_i0_p5_ORF_typecomplete_len515_score75_41Bestrophin/PF01062_21/2_7e17_NODE_16_length_22882_cov_82_653956_g14_i01798819532
MSGTYRMRKWYDHWLVMGRIHGSVIPRTLLSIGTAILLNALFFEVVVDPEHAGRGGGLFGNPVIYTLFTTSASFILAFTTGICYNRFWEALSHMYQMSNRMSIGATLALAQDPSQFESEEEANREKRWRAEFLHDISVLHAVCVQSLFAEYVEAPLDILGGMTIEEQAQLAAVKNQPALVFNWIAASLQSRLHTDKCTVMLSNAVNLLSQALTDWNNAQKVSRVPLPLPFQQSLAWSDLIVLIFTPLTIACYSYNLWFSMALTFAAELIYHGVYMANVAMQQPFGTRSTDLPLVSVHREFIKRVLSFVTADLVEELNSMFATHAPKDLTEVKITSADPSQRLGFKTISMTQFPHISGKGLPAGFPLRNRSEPALSPPPESSESSINVPATARPSPIDIDVQLPTTSGTIRPRVSSAERPWRNSFLDASRPPQLHTYRSTMIHDKFAPSGGRPSRVSIDRPPEGVFVGDKLLAMEYVLPPELDFQQDDSKSLIRSTGTLRRASKIAKKGSRTELP